MSFRSYTVLQNLVQNLYRRDGAATENELINEWTWVDNNIFHEIQKNNNSRICGNSTKWLRSRYYLFPEIYLKIAGNTSTFFVRST